MLRALLFAACGLRAGVGADLAWPAEGGLDDAVELLLVHHAAAEDDAARRVHEHEVRAHLPQIIPLERPHLSVVRELGRGLSPARGDGRAGGEALETARVARADAASLLGGTGLYQHVAGLGVQHAVKEPARAHDARAHAGADGHVDGVLEPLAAAEDHFAEAGNVHVRVVGHRNPEGVGERGAKTIASPRELGRLEDGTVAPIFGVDAGRAEGADAQRVHIAGGEPLDHLRDGLGGRKRRGLHTVENLAVAGHHGTNHLGPAGLEGAEPHLLFAHVVLLTKGRPQSWSTAGAHNVGLFRVTFRASPRAVSTEGAHNVGLFRGDPTWARGPALRQTGRARRAARFGTSRRRWRCRPRARRA